MNFACKNTKKRLLLLVVFALTTVTASDKNLNFDGIKLRDGSKLELVKIKAGSFMMGSPLDEPKRNNDEMRHKVIITHDFWIGKYKITQKQFMNVLGVRWLHRPGETDIAALPPWSWEEEMYMKYGYLISWGSAKEFCDELNKQFAEQIPTGYKFDLPTEAQWEYACRAGTTSSYAYTNRWNEFWDKNSWNVHNMHTEAFEWCRDFYGEYNEKNNIDPTGPVSGEYRVLRSGYRRVLHNGGYRTTKCRSAQRLAGNPYGPGYTKVENTTIGQMHMDVSFRVVLVPIEKPAKYYQNPMVE